MACKVYPEDGRCFYGAARHLPQSRGIKRQLCTSKSSNYVRLDVPAMVPCYQSTKNSVQDVVSVDKFRGDFTNTYEELPYNIRNDNFIMNNMDEITYWIYTRRPPCLMKYDMAKKQSEQAQCSKPKISTSIHSISDETNSTPKKKKRKISILDDDSVSVKEQPNLFFDTSNPPKIHQVIESSKSDTVTDTDFNIKKSSVQNKVKRGKLQKNNRTTVHKKNKIFASTPVTNTALRRSVRNSRKSFNDSSQMNTSFELLTAGTPNNISQNITNTPIIDYVKPAERCKKTIEKIELDVGTPNGKASEIAPEKHKVAVNGDFENLSDVSGFTANYIRSTKNASKNHKKGKNKETNTLAKGSRQSQKNHKTVVCVNKSVNTGEVEQNNSTDSSQNCLNIVTSDPKVDVNQVNKSTSLLKFIDIKTTKPKQSKSNSKVENVVDTPNEQSSLSSRRYPRRNRSSNCVTTPSKCDTTMDTTLSNTPKKTRNRSHNNSTNGTSFVQARRTRSGRSFLNSSEPVVPNDSDPVSSRATMNVASPQANSSKCKTSTLKGKTVKKTLRQKKSTNKSEQSTNCRDSIRDKSGFAACFSDSDDDKPLKKQLFFC